MPAIASLEDLKKLNAEIKELKEKHPEAFSKVLDLMKRNRRIGYKNFCKLFLGERTPEALKTEE